ncbi:hypothetical protein PAXRUDRAFT_18523 [Paxillus rubicundulus Ve08.2h10]|uniref:Uncharacterized protein n=1 Tax=Paxillus rubicundulus Ve08.2h10 TaxID=930991 RepID=A0A0D0CLB3_9AGAM|nr:hypothetical protein PAXRUDRAFT_18523 [Paxillus rubicundulus Ve08.2h10]
MDLVCTPIIILHRLTTQNSEPSSKSKSQPPPMPGLLHLPKDQISHSFLQPKLKSKGLFLENLFQSQPTASSSKSQPRLEDEDESNNQHAHSTPPAMNAAVTTCKSHTSPMGPKLPPLLVHIINSPSGQPTPPRS